MRSIRTRSVPKLLCHCLQQDRIFAVLVKDITACYLIDLCGLCGRNPQRGVCFPKRNVSRCQCFSNENDPTTAYAGEFCRPEKIEITPRPLQSSRSTPIALGIVSGIAGLLLATAVVLTIVVVRRRRRKASAGDSTRLFHTDHPEPLDIPAENIQVYMNTMEPNPDRDEQETFHESFFADLDQQMVDNANPLDESILAYDPIYELDNIIDNDEISMAFRDSIEDLLVSIEQDSYVVRPCRKCIVFLHSLVILELTHILSHLPSYS